METGSGIYSVTWRWSRHNPAGLSQFVVRGSARWLGLAEAPPEYQNSPNKREALVRKIYEVLLEKGILYDREQYDPARFQQVIRPPSEILGWPRRATCLDLVLLFSGLCLDFELVPALILFEGHAIAAVSLTHDLRDWEDDLRPGWDRLADAPLHDEAALRRIFGSADKWLLIECTGFSRLRGSSTDNSAPETIGRVNGLFNFERAISAAREQIGPTGRKPDFALDVAIAQYRWSIRPYAVPGTLRQPSPIPSMDQRLLERDVEVNACLAAIAQAGVNEAGNHSRVVVLHGMPGAGKTTIAAQIARHFVQAHQEVFWARVGEQKSHLTSVQTQLARQAGYLGPAFTSEFEGSAELQQIYSDRHCLIVLDDIWHYEQFRALRIEKSGPPILLTTRNAQVAGGHQTAIISVPELSPSAALELLSIYSETPVDELPSEAEAIASACWYLPLTLASMGSVVRARPARWAILLDRLRLSPFTALENLPEDYPHKNLMNAIAASVSLLTEREARCYRKFAILPANVRFGVKICAILWGTDTPDDADVSAIVEKLVAASLLSQDDGGDLYLHSLLSDFTKLSVPDLVDLNRDFLRAYSSKCPEGWASGPEDGYFPQNLAFHLAAAQKQDEIRALLTDARWIGRKVSSGQLPSLIADYSYIKGDHVCETIWECLQESEQVLVRSPCELSSQLLGRLPAGGSDEIRRLSAQLAACHSRPWLRPMTRSLAGKALHLTFRGHTWHDLRSCDLRMGLCVSDSQIISQASAVYSDDGGQLLLWNVRTGSLEHAHDDWTHGKLIGVSADGRTAMFSNRSTVAFWDLQNWRLERLVELTDESLLAVTPDGRLLTCERHAFPWHIGPTGLTVRDASGRKLLSLEATTSSRTGGLAHNRFPSAVTDERLAIAFGSVVHIWNLNSGRVIRSFDNNAHQYARGLYDILGSDISSLTFSDDGARLLAGRVSGTVHAWNIESGTELFIVPSSELEVSALCSWQSGRYVAIGHVTGNITLLDTAGPSLHFLQGHDDRVLALSVTANGDYVISGSFNNVRIWNIRRLVWAPLGERWSNPVGVAYHRDAGTAIIARPNGMQLASRAGAKDRFLPFTWFAYRHGARRYAMEPDRECVSIGTFAATKDGHVGVAATTENLFGSLLTIWDFKRERLVGMTTGPGVTRAIYLTPDGSLALCLPLMSKELFSVETSLYRSHYVASYFWSLLGLAGQLSGPSLLSRVYRKTTYRRGTTRVLLGHEDFINAVVICPAGVRAYTGSQDKTVRVWDLRSGSEMAVLRGHKEEVAAMAVDPSGRFLISISKAGEMISWDLRNFEILHVKALPAKSDITAIELSLNGEYLFAGDQDGAIHVAGLGGVDEHLLLTLQGHADRITCLVATASGDGLISTGADGRVVEWTLPNFSLLASFTSDREISECIELGSEEVLVTDGAGMLHYLRRCAYPSAREPVPALEEISLQDYGVA